MLSSRSLIQLVCEQAADAIYRLLVLTLPRIVVMIAIIAEKHLLNGIHVNVSIGDFQLGFKPLILNLAF